MGFPIELHQDEVDCQQEGCNQKAAVEWDGEVWCHEHAECLACVAEVGQVQQNQN